MAFIISNSSMCSMIFFLCCKNNYFLYDKNYCLVCEIGNKFYIIIHSESFLSVLYIFPNLIESLTPLWKVTFYKHISAPPPFKTKIKKQYSLDTCCSNARLTCISEIRFKTLFLSLLTVRSRTHIIMFASKHALWGYSGE